jgi:hypothetical protein
VGPFVACEQVVEESPPFRWEQFDAGILGPWVAVVGEGEQVAAVGRSEPEVVAVVKGVEPSKGDRHVGCVQRAGGDRKGEGFGDVGMAGCVSLRFDRIFPGSELVLLDRG